jgi:signal transduction histidine kinase/CheY-like chemotaxis protein
MKPYPAAIEALVERDRIHALYRQGPLTAVIAVVIGACVVAAMWGHVPAAVLGVWYALICATQASRILLCRAFRRANPGPERVRVWARRYMWNMGLGGALFGSVAYVMFPEGDPLAQVFLMVCVTGLAAGSITANAYHPPTMLVYLAPLLLPMLVRVATAGSLEYQIIAFAFGFYLVVITIFGRNQAALIRESIAVGHENAMLVEELKRKTDIAEKASLAKSRFFAAASHDLRQPLQALGLFAASLREAERRPEDARKFDQILSSVDALESLFDELLDVSRLDAGYVQPNRSHFSAERLFARLEAAYAPVAAKNGLALRFRPRAPALYSDPVLLERVLGNLISNALRYTPRGGVLVGWRRRGRAARIEVWDTGIGIPREEFERIFDEFYQLGNPERDRRRGLGLGLATVKRISLLLESPVTLASRPGRGSVFRITVPLGDAAAVVVPAPQPAAGDINALAGKVVVVIEDEGTVRDGLATLLAQWQCRPVAAPSAQEILDLLAAQSLAPDAVIADYRLRDHHTGIAAIETLRGRFGAALPALLVSGDTTEELFRAARERSLLFVAKPISAARLRAGLLHLLSRPRAQAEVEPSSLIRGEAA